MIPHIGKSAVIGAAVAIGFIALISNVDALNGVYNFVFGAKS